MKSQHDQFQTGQRLRVGVIGLLVVVALIAVAGWIIDSTAGGTATNGTTEIALNLAADNAADAREPLAEIGAAPGSFNEQVGADR